MSARFSSSGFSRPWARRLSATRTGPRICSRGSGLASRWRRDPAGEAWRDPSLMSIEDFGNADNLMIDACLAEQGRPLVRVEARADELFAALDGFEACLRMAAREFATGIAPAVGAGTR